MKWKSHDGGSVRVQLFCSSRKVNVRKTRQCWKSGLRCGAEWLLFTVFWLERESAETLTMFQNKVERQLLRDSWATPRKRRMEAMWKEHLCRLLGRLATWQL